MTNRQQIDLFNERSEQAPLKEIFQVSIIWYIFKPKKFRTFIKNLELGKSWMASYKDTKES